MVNASEAKARVANFGHQAKLAVTTKEGFKNAIEVKSSDFADSSYGFVWSNAHMDPTPPAERSWSAIHFFAVWFSYNFTSGAWATASALLKLNLVWWQAIVACLIGSIISAGAVVLNSRQSSVYHIGFPTLQRVSFGLYGSLFPVFTRAVVAVLWIGVTVYQSSLFLDVAFRCVFGDSYYDMKNTFSPNAGITTRKFVAAFIIWIGSYPIMALKIHKLRHLWTIKALVVPPVTIGFFIYCMAAGAKGATSNDGTPTPATGSELSWAYMYAIQAIIGSFSPLISSNPDIARYAKKPSDTFWWQFVTIIFWKTMICMIGIFGTNALAYKYGPKTTPWNLWDACHLVLDHNWSGGVRFAIFLFAVVQCASEQVKNMSANLISFGADTACLLPKYLNINRGMILGLTIGFVIQPWYILATAKSYLTFLTGYSIFLGAIPAIAVMDYALRKGNIDVLSIYTPKKDYWYKGGFNWKAYVGYFMAVWPLCPGLAAQFDKNASIGQGWKNLYSIGWLFAVFCSATVYAVLSLIFKDPAMSEAKRSKWEVYAENQRELLDKEDPKHSIPVLEGSDAGDSEEGGVKGFEKDLTKTEATTMSVN